MNMPTHNIPSNKLFVETSCEKCKTEIVVRLITIIHCASILWDPIDSIATAKELKLVMLLFVWNTLTVSLTVSTTIPLHQDPLGIDVAGVQGMQ